MQFRTRAIHAGQYKGLATGTLVRPIYVAGVSVQPGAGSKNRRLYSLNR